MDRWKLFLEDLLILVLLELHNIQATGVTNIKLYDAANASGNIIFESTFGSEGLDLYVPGNGIRFENTIYADVTGSGSVTIGYTG